VHPDGRRVSRAEWESMMPDYAYARGRLDVAQEMIDRVDPAKQREIRLTIRDVSSTAGTMINSLSGSDTSRRKQLALAIQENPAWMKKYERGRETQLLLIEDRIELPEWVDISRPENNFSISFPVAPHVAPNWFGDVKGINFSTGLGYFDYFSLDVIRAKIPAKHVDLEARVQNAVDGILSRDHRLISDGYETNSDWGVHRVLITEPENVDMFFNHRFIHSNDVLYLLVVGFDSQDFDVRAETRARFLESFKITKQH
jgi:hypothetical protein